MIEKMENLGERGRLRSRLSNGFCDKAVKNFSQSPLQSVVYDEIWLDE